MRGDIGLAGAHIAPEQQPRRRRQHLLPVFHILPGLGDLRVVALVIFKGALPQGRLRQTHTAVAGHLVLKFLPPQFPPGDLLPDGLADAQTPHLQLPLSQIQFLLSGTVAVPAVDQAVLTQIFVLFDCLRRFVKQILHKLSPSSQS